MIGMLQKMTYYNLFRKDRVSKRGDAGRLLSMVDAIICFRVIDNSKLQNLKCKWINVLINKVQERVIPGGL